MSRGLFSRTLTAQETAKHQIARTVDQGGILMQQADRKGREYANSRGILNTSYGAKASQEAVLDKATQIGMFDAQQHSNQALTNQRLAHTSHENAATRTHQRSMQKDQFGFQLSLQRGQHAFQAGQNKLNRQHDRGILTQQQDYNAQQSQLNREHDRGILSQQQDYNAQQSQLNREHDKGLFTDQLDFNAQQAQLNRDHDTQQTQQQQDWASKERVDMQAHETFMTELRGSIESGLIDRQVAANLQGHYLQSIESTNGFFNEAITDIMNNPHIPGEGKDKDGNITNPKQDYIDQLIGFYQDPETGQRVSPDAEGAVRVPGLRDYRLQDTQMLYAQSPLWISAWGQLNGNTPSTNTLPPSLPNQQGGPN